MRHSEPAVTPLRQALTRGLAREVIRFGIAVAAAALVIASVVAPQAARAQRQQANQPSKPETTRQSQQSQQQPKQQPVVAADGSFNVMVGAPLRTAPGAEVVGEIRKPANVEVLSRDRGWARIRVEAWVPDSVLAPADASYSANLSAADLRADPAGSRGKTVVWNVEFLALQTADPLRHGLADEEPYMLARGPNSENALLYLVVPPSLIGTVRALKPLATITVTARVRDGKSDPVGVPILDVETISRRR